MKSKVKAVTLVKKGQLEITEYPVCLENDEIIVKIVHAGICGTDWHIVGKERLDLNYPVILGHENVGTIAQLPHSKIKDAQNNPLKEGDLVVWAPRYEVCGDCWYCKWLPSTHGFSLCQKGKSHGFVTSKEPPHLLGGWAYYSILPKGTWIYKVPENVNAKVAVLVDPLASVTGVERAASIHSNWLNEGLYLGSTVVVQGSGVIGYLAAVKAQVLGAGKVIMIGGPEHRLKEAKDHFGVNEIINIENHSHTQRLEKVKEITDGVGADVVVECAGVPEAFVEAMELVRRGGVVVELGNFTLTGSIEINPSKHICRNDITIIGQFGYVPQQFRKDLALLERWSKIYPFERLVTHQFPLEKFEEALECVGSQQSIKAVFSPDM